MTLDTDDVTIEMDLTVERGVGYLGAERAEALPIGVIAVDAIFTPVRKINYWVESMRVGQMTNYDKLTIEIETDGTIGPEEAVRRPSVLQANQFRPSATAGLAAPPVVAPTGQARRPPRLFAEGSTPAAIAHTLSISAQTLRNHLHHINRKLRTHNRLEAVTHALRRGLIE